MPNQFFDIGTNCESDAVLRNQYAHRVYAAIRQSPNFKIIEHRELLGAGIIVVDCLNNEVPSRNPQGIKNRERLALVFDSSLSRQPEVRALRKDFPVGLHQNEISEGQPVSFCLYEEPWSSVIRSWTAAAFLKRILWWLTNAAGETLHQETQALEPLFFSSGIRLILPPDFSKKFNTDEPLNLCRTEKALLAFWKKDAEYFSEDGAPDIMPLITTLPAVVHSKTDRLPTTLGSLAKSLASKGVDWLPILIDQLRKAVPSKGISEKDERKILLLLRIPLKRREDSEPERTEVVAFLANNTLWSLGENFGILFKQEGVYYNHGMPPDNVGAWETVTVEPVDIRFAIDQEYARKTSSIDMSSADFKGALLGVGSLGGTLAELWSKEGWGKWVLIDHDVIEPHNVARHVSKHFHIGWHKTNAVAQCARNNYYPGTYCIASIPKAVFGREHKAVQEVLNNTDFIVDASTTLDVPRELAAINEIPRCSSVFFTPSGFGSVLLAENPSRTIRLDALEAQYYRLILNSEWGTTHLEKHNADLWVGNGCRDASNVIPTELVQLHSAILGRQLRKTRNQETGLIQVFHFSDETSELTSATYIPHDVVIFEVAEWSVIIDTEIVQRLITLRSEKLPAETGGVLLGYIDHKTSKIYIVDVLSAPSDSEETKSSFVRGTEGLQDILKEAKKRTSGIVSYLGEWHSHPDGCKTTPSGLDRDLLDYLTKQLATDGHPALMAIVGETNINFLFSSELQ